MGKAKGRSKRKRTTAAPTKAKTSPRPKPTPTRTATPAATSPASTPPPTATPTPAATPVRTPSPCAKEEADKDRADADEREAQRALDLFNTRKTEKNARDSKDPAVIAKYEAKRAGLTTDRDKAIAAQDAARKALLKCRKQHGLPVTSLNLYWATKPGEIDRDGHFSTIHMADGGAYHETQFILTWVDSTPAQQKEEWEGTVFYPEEHRSYVGLLKNGFITIEVTPEELTDRQRLRATALHAAGLNIPWPFD
jgi:hypothetical protein